MNSHLRGTLSKRVYDILTLVGLGFEDFSERSDDIWVHLLVAGQVSERHPDNANTIHEALKTRLTKLSPVYAEDISEGSTFPEFKKSTTEWEIKLSKDKIFASGFETRPDSFGHFLKVNLPSLTKEVINFSRSRALNATELLEAEIQLTVGLNAMLKDSLILFRQPFPRAKIGGVAKVMVEQRQAPWETRWINRILLEDAFSSELGPFRWRNDFCVHKAFELLGITKANVQRLAGNQFRWGCSAFTMDDILDLPKLADRLNQGLDPVCKHLGSVIGTTGIAILNSSGQSSGRENQARSLMVRLLNRFVFGQRIDQQDWSKGISKSSESAHLIGTTDPKNRNYIHINRLLLQDAFPTELSRYVVPDWFDKVSTFPAAKRMRRRGSNKEVATSGSDAAQDSNSQDAQVHSPQHVPGTTIELIKASLDQNKEQFAEYIQTAKNLIEQGEWAKAFSDANHPEHHFAAVNMRVADLQGLKGTDVRSRRVPNIGGDADGWVLESTWEAFRSASWRFPELSKYFDSVVNALKTIDDIDRNSTELNVNFDRFYWVDKIGIELPPRRIYLLLLFLVYVLAEPEEASRASRSRELLKRNAFFRLLKSFPPKINCNFYLFLGEELFCAGGEPFTNLAWETYDVNEGDTLRSIILKFYPDGSASISDCAKGLREANEWLKDVDLDEDLHSIAKANGVTRIVLAPPWGEGEKYRDSIRKMSDWRRKRNE